MGFTTEEIDHIQHLAYHRDLNNVALAFALMQGRPWMDLWRTPLYWMYNRYLWAEQTQQASEINVYYCQHTPTVVHLPPLLYQAIAAAPPALSLEVERQQDHLGVDWSIIVHHLWHYGVRLDEMREFAFWHGTPTTQGHVLPLFQSRSSSGTLVLNLGGLKLGRFPEAVLDYSVVEQLELWGNGLRHLPDRWEELQLLQQVDLATNQLSALPDSFLALPRLERLYLQHNAFEWSTLLHCLRQMPQLQQVVVASIQQQDFKVLEELVQTGLHRHPIWLQDVFLALKTQGQTISYPLPSPAVLLEALASGVEPLPLLVRQYLLQQHTSMAPLPSNVSIAVLGLVTYATRLAIDTLAQRYPITFQLTPQTTHITLGDQPTLSTPIKDKPYLFLSEQQLQKLV